MSVRQFPNSPRLTVSTEVRSPKVEIVIVCEGANTEPKYFEDCARYYGAGKVRLTLMPAAGVPLTLVKAAIVERQALVEKYRRNKDSFDACFRVWAVFDRDEHPNVSTAIELAGRFGIDVAFSNPCFELWPVLHLENFGAQFDRHTLQAHLTSLMPSYSHQEGAIINFDQIKDLFPVAYKLARKHNEDRYIEGAAFGNPYTTVGVLVRKIIENGKYANRAMLNILDQLPPNSQISSNP